MIKEPKKFGTNSVIRLTGAREPTAATPKGKPGRFESARNCMVKSAGTLKIARMSTALDVRMPARARR